MFVRGFLVCAILAVGLTAGAAEARAQSTRPKPPGQSTSINGGSGGGLVVDFDKPANEAKPAEEASPDTAKPTGRDALEHGCSTGNAEVDAAVREAGTRSGVDPCLIVAVMAQESGYRRYAVSPKGAAGYMQLMPATAARFGVTDIFDARQNITAGAFYLRFLLQRFNGSLELTLAGYNAGEGAVERYGMRIPPFLETQNYVRVIAGRYLSHHAGQAVYRVGTAEPPGPAPVAAGPSRPTAAWRISVSFDEPKE
jgi:hypothetical protein